MNLEKIDRWISVYEELPEGGKRVVIFCPERYPTISVGYLDVLSISKGWIDETEQWGDEGSPGWVKVTYWMLLLPPNK